MVFSSPVFLFAFLPITLLIYFCLPRIAKNLFLFIASFIFYAWGEVHYFYLILLSIAINYILALAIHASSRRRAKLFLATALVINLCPLIYYKYITFIKSTLGIESTSSLTLPLGISFFTFHAISYIVDVYRQTSAPQKSIINLGLYITNFPQLVAGPIVRYPEIKDQLAEHRASSELFIRGVERFILGLAKKVLIANTVALVADTVFKTPSGELSTGMAWLGIICYTLQLYFDFSGYSDMAIGLGRMFGFHFPENFNYPYIARSIKDFWRRWHISLSNWFRDYVYIPLGGNKKGKLNTYFNLLIVFFLCGLWHGAGWPFVVWGLWHGAFLILERLPLGKVINKFPSVFQHLYTLSIVTIGWVFFRSDTLTYASDFLLILAGVKNSELFFSLPYFPDTDILLAIVVGIIGSTRFMPYLINKINSYALHPNILETVRIGTVGILFIASAMALASGTYNPFIYFRF